MGPNLVLRALASIGSDSSDRHSRLHQSSLSLAAPLPSIIHVYLLLSGVFWRGVLMRPDRFSAVSASVSCVLS
jgi:hypothetical protein